MKNTDSPHSHRGILPTIEGRGKRQKANGKRRKAETSIEKVRRKIYGSRSLYRSQAELGATASGGVRRKEIKNIRKESERQNQGMMYYEKR